MTKENQVHPARLLSSVQCGKLKAKKK